MKVEFFVVVSKLIENHLILFKSKLVERSTSNNQSMLFDCFVDQKKNDLHKMKKKDLLPPKYILKASRETNKIFIKKT